MNTLDEELNVQAETRQMKKLQMYQKLALFTLLKFKWSIIAVFLLTIVAATVLRAIQYSRSPHKHEGSVTLFYTPRASEEVKPLSMNHVLGVFSRQQIFHQLVEEMHLTPKQRSVLKKSIEVKLLRDHNDMFVITGIGESDEYVRQLVNTFVAIGIRNYEEYRISELRNFLNAREQRLRELQKYQGEKIENKNGVDIISDGIATGAVQIPASGTPIIMMADRQTTGGYAKIATVISADLQFMAQAAPGTRLRFVAVSEKEAVSLKKEEEHRLKQMEYGFFSVR